MSRSIVSKGKNVKEAVDRALNVLGTKNSGVDIEIIETEYKGIILGLGSKPAVVRVTLKQLNNAEEHPEHHLNLVKLLEMEINNIDFTEDSKSEEAVELKQAAAIQEDLHGKVWVREGHIFCKDAPNKYPLVSPAQGVKLYKNNEAVEKTVIVSENDILTVELSDEERAPKWELLLSDNKMEALLKIVPGVRIYRRLKDAAPSNFIQLEVEEKIIPIMIDSGSMMNEIRAIGIVHGVDYTEIARACTSDEAGTFIIAKGNPPTPGKNGCFLPIKEVTIKKGVMERPDGTVDYREIQEFPSVERGQVLGVIQPPMPGIPGQTTTNEFVPPPEALPLTVQEGRGVVLVEDGTKVVAIEAGQPDIKMIGTTAKISVVPKLVVGTDVSLQSGNVRYIGDVEVLGSVQDGMLVEAQGNILVHGSVFKSKIIAGNSVIIHKNAISSTISAGKSSMLEQELTGILGGVYNQLSQMMVAMHQIMSVSAFKVRTIDRTGLGPLLKILCDGKFKSVPPLIISLCNKIKTGKCELDPEWLSLAELLHQNFITPQASGLRSMYDLEVFLKKVEMVYKSAATEKEAVNCFIKASYLQNCELYSAGDIQIAGNGIYNSKLYAKGMIQLDGYVRGGEIFAEKGVKIREAGTKGGIPTKIQVPKDQTIMINCALEETVIQIGNKTHTFTRETQLVRARLDEIENLILQ
ncbi:FapA family protein [Paenibacillus cremeus]|uniref:FapA family protein n=1 Tax=Paenibacillus cremeus TaxID=2163881 RepID=UPI0016492BA0|nr:FapA family protein [Paenibacillus cremeus]